MRTQVLSTVPNKKVQEALEQTLRDCETCSQNQAKLDNCCKICRVFNTAIHRYADSNIPVKYWRLEMDEKFKGDQILMDRYGEIVSDLKKTYQQGTALCFAGKNGTGKTMTCCNILKRAVEKGYTGLYCTLLDIVTMITNASHEDKIEARKELLTVDYLVIDEFSLRFFSSDSASDLYGRILEDVFRNRAQNNMPLLLCTNSPNIVEGFNGEIKASISSLMNYVKTVSVLGKDYRKEETK